MKLDKNDILTGLKKAGDAVTQGVSDLRKSTRLTFDISAKETELADLYRELGKSVYEESKGEHERLTPDALKAMIEACEQELETLKRKKAAQSAAPICPACGRANRAQDTHCTDCGAALPERGLPQGGILPNLRRQNPPRQGCLCGRCAKRGLLQLSG